MTTSITPAGAAHSLKKIALEALASLAIAAVSTGAIIEIFTPEWSRLLVEISSLADQQDLTSASATSTRQPAAQTVVIDSPRLETTQVATISASFLKDLVSAIMEATSPAQLASAEAQLTQALED